MYCFFFSEGFLFTFPAQRLSDCLLDSVLQICLGFFIKLGKHITGFICNTAAYILHLALLLFTLDSGHDVADADLAGDLFFHHLLFRNHQTDLAIIVLCQHVIKMTGLCGSQRTYNRARTLILLRQRFIIRFFHDRRRNCSCKCQLAVITLFLIRFRFRNRCFLRRRILLF